MSNCAHSAPEWVSAIVEIPDAHCSRVVYTGPGVCRVRRRTVGAIHGLAIALTLLVWLASLIALVALPIQLRQARRASQRQEFARPRVRTIDRFRAAARMVSFGPRRARQMDGVSQQHTAYRPRPPYPAAQRVQSPPDEMTRRQRRVDANGPQSQYPNWSSDPERKYRTLQSIAAVRQQSDGRGLSTRERRAQPPAPRDRREQYDR